MVKRRRKDFGKVSPGKIKEALCSESFPRKEAKTLEKGWMVPGHSALLAQGSLE